MPPVMTRTAREVLNELKWSTHRLAEATIWYSDRARAEGFRIILGSEIAELERRYFSTASMGRLPYYKIERIVLDGETVFSRDEADE